MTNEETLEAMDIIRAYEYLNQELQMALDSLTDLQKKKDNLIERLEGLKIQELDFMSRYREKYGDKNFLEDLNLETQR
jgi:hypothetical protein